MTRRRVSLGGVVGVTCRYLRLLAREPEERLRLPRTGRIVEYNAWLSDSKKKFAAIENDATRVASK